MRRRRALEWISRSAAAKRLGVTAMMVTKYCRRGLPSRDDKRVPWPGALEWPSFLLRPSGRPRTSSQCLQHPLLLDALQAPFQKIDLQRLLTNLTFQLRDPAFR